MKTGLIALLGYVLGSEGVALAADAGWPPLEKALKGPRFGAVSVSAEKARVAADVYPISLPGEKCPKISVEAYRVYGVTVRFEPKRTLTMSIVGGRLAEGFDAYRAYVAAAPADPGSEDGCLFPKSGLSVLQIGRYLFAFPTAGSDAYAYTKALPIVVKALRDFFGPGFPKQLIYAPCGTLFPKLVSVDEYLDGAENPRPAGSAAQPGAAPEEQAPAVPARR